MVQVKEKYKKFMFNRRFDQTDDELERAQSAIKDALLPENKAAEEVIDDLEKIINEEQPLIEPESVYIPPTYTQEQLDQAIEQAKKEGLAEGRKQAEADIMKVEADALVQVEKQITAIKSKVDGDAESSETGLIGVCSIIFKKLMPELEKKGGFSEIEAILRQNFSRLVKEPKLKISVNAKQTPQLKEKLADIAKKAGFLGKIVIESKEDLNLSDIRVEWDRGGIVRDSSLLMSEVDAILSSYLKPGEKDSGVE